MRVKANYTVFPRKMKTGRTIYYYQCYDENGVRSNSHSTGESLKTLANNKCQQLLKEGALIPAQRKKIMTFGEYAQGWWEWDTCQYLQSKKHRKGLNQDYVDGQRQFMINWLVPYFGKMRLDRITREDCDRFLTNLPEQETKGRKYKSGRITASTGKKLKESTANTIYGTLRIMLKQAAAEKLILFSPAETIEKLMAVEKKVGILTPVEARGMFAPEMKSAVPLLEGGQQAALGAAEKADKKSLEKFTLAYELAELANMTAAVTGMRIGEVLGLKGSCIFENYIKVAGQYDENHIYRETKTKKARQIPSSPTILDPLHALKELNGDGFLFSDDGGATPISRYMFRKALADGLSRIGIDAEEKKERNLTPHAWRHFFNTTLRTNDVSDAKTQALIGHVTNQMSDRYTEFDTVTFTEVRDIQDSILLQDKPVKQADQKDSGSQSDEADDGDGAGDRGRKPGRIRWYGAAGRGVSRRVSIGSREKRRHV
ncbi:hypothetical protein AGMMS4952_07950 [Spirochaetia bacterium]|nr:hypothetical protein AGMMS4952_07950 [Spirochaetia bacterium]